jgi:hypothetical protein
VKGEGEEAPISHFCVLEIRDVPEFEGAADPGHRLVRMIVLDDRQRPPPSIAEPSRKMCPFRGSSPNESGKISVTKPVTVCVLVRASAV